MRLIFALLTYANLQWARAALVRSEALYRDGDGAFAEGERRYALAQELARRAQLSRI